MLVRIEDDGAVGIGEASPLPGFSRDTLTDCEVSFDQLVSSASATAPAAPPFPAALHFALETARLDLIATRLGLPAARALAPRPVRDRAPLSALLDLFDPDRDAARRAVDAGFRTLKLKIGRAGRFAEELAALTGLRRAVGPDIALRLDANGTLADPVVALRALADAIGPELVEEPVPAERLREVFSDRPPARLALDESLIRLTTAEIAGLIHDGLTDALVLKPMLLGGIQACLDLAALAKERGVPVTVSHAFDGPIALAAACALALALPGTLLACGLAPHAGLAAWPRADLLCLDGPEIVVPAGAGLGVVWQDGAP
jgi:o-succinylbenzoate synthase